jgi:hypothetical protein
LIQYISNNPQEDRNFYKKNKNNNIKPPHIYGKDLEKWILRNMFIDDEADINITQLIANYFLAVRQKWPQAWDKVQNNNILNKSTGFIALMKFFRNAYLSFNKPNQVISKEEFYTLFNKILLSEDSFTKDRYLPGTKGQSDLYRDLLEGSGLNK